MCIAKSSTDASNVSMQLNKTAQKMSKKDYTGSHTACQIIPLQILQKSPTWQRGQSTGKSGAGSPKGCCLTEYEQYPVGELIF